MKAEEYYFEDIDSEVCYDREYFKDQMLYHEVTEMGVYEAIPDRTTGAFWCKVECFCGDDSSDTCGKQCRQYAPRNGKNGCCKHYTTKLYVHGKRVILSLIDDELTIKS